AAVTRDDTKYSLGSVLNHVLLHQTIIGLEAEKQFELIGDYPDVVIGCCGGGSNFAGLAFPFLRHRLAGKEIRFVAAEPHACPTMSKGEYRYDFGDTTMLTPLIKMYTLGHSFIPPGIHAGGLRYHGMAALVSFGIDLGLIEPAAFHQTECFEAAQQFAATEGVIPAPETSHAIRAVINEAVRCREEGKEECIVFNFSGHGLCDMAAYDKYLAGELEDFAYPQEKIAAAIAELPTIE
ncbi:MAG: pyridoxal-phosphate dependent enzyme, partial [Planctomycetes bacterium]|nr:pyridoxal-phosphate dependent enzyme [Planctomycetota bacterium]